MNCWLVPSAIEGLIGVTAIDTSVAGVTIRRVEPLTEPEVAAIVVDPAAKPVAEPWDPAALLTTAVPSSDELHDTSEVRS